MESHKSWASINTHPRNSPGSNAEMWNRWVNKVWIDLPYLLTPHFQSLNFRWRGEEICKQLVSPHQQTGMSNQCQTLSKAALWLTPAPLPFLVSPKKSNPLLQRHRAVGISVGISETQPFKFCLGMPVSICTVRDCSPKAAKIPLHHIKISPPTHMIVSRSALLQPESKGWSPLIAIAKGKISGENSKALQQTRILFYFFEQNWRNTKKK